MALQSAHATDESHPHFPRCLIRFADTYSSARSSSAFVSTVPKLPPSFSSSRNSAFVSTARASRLISRATLVSSEQKGTAVASSERKNSATAASSLKRSSSSSTTSASSNGNSSRAEKSTKL